MRIQDDGETLLVQPQGEVDLLTAPQLSAAFLGCSDAHRRLVCDLSEVTFMDSTGLRALIAIIAYIQKKYPEIPVLLDAKRGDIGSTSQAYARALFDVYGADAVTAQPYLGYDALEPFLNRADRGVFILCRTSNPGARELQDLSVGASGDETEPLYLRLARRVANEWNANGNCGLVVGATYPEELCQVREIVGDLPILAPGVGAQGGDLEATVRAGIDSVGQGLLISVSQRRQMLIANKPFVYDEEAERYSPA
jgi:orotidine-5'-phosphate decarboxylase